VINGRLVIAPAYIGFFRWHAEFRSAHSIDSVETTDHIHDIASRWPETNAPSFIYRLGPPMVPPMPMKLGNIHPSMRSWISLDLLISGAATD